MATAAETFAFKAPRFSAPLTDFGGMMAGFTLHRVLGPMNWTVTCSNQGEFGHIFDQGTAPGRIRSISLFVV